MNQSAAIQRFFLWGDMPKRSAGMTGSAEKTWLIAKFLLY